MKNEQNTGITTLCILLFLAVIAMAVYIAINESKLNDLSTNSKSEALYQDDTKDLVYSFERQVQNINGENIKIKLPYINIFSSYANEINSSINAMSLEMYKDCEYYTYLNDSILSVVIEGKIYANDNKLYTVYNIDIYTGDRVSNEDILAYLGLNETELQARLPRAYHNSFLKRFPNITELYSDYTESTEYKNTVASANYSLDIPMYIGLNKSLKLIGRIYSPAGPTFYYEIVDVI